MDSSEQRDRIARARRGDHEALQALLQPLHPRLWAYLLKAVGDPHDAEDLLQETYVRVLRKIGRFRPSGSFESWVFTIASHLVVDRARRRRPIPFDDLADLRAPESDRPDRRAIAEETLVRIRAALDELHPAQRRVFLLRIQRGLPFREIAQITGCPLGTALGRMRDAVRHLRSSLRELAPGGESSP